MVDWGLACKICVCLFAWLTGWAYFHHADKSCAYSFRKIVSVMAEYAIIVIFCFLVAIWVRADLSGVSPVLEMLPFSADELHPLMIHAWYIGFYLVVLILLPFMHLVCNRKMNITNIITTLILLYVSYKIMLVTRAFYLWEWLPCVLSGYICAKLRVLDRMREHITKWPWSLLVGGVFLAGSIVMYRYFTYPLGIQMNAGAFYAPFFCGGCLLLAPFISRLRLSALLELLGRHSLNIWLIHGLFHSRITREALQPLAYAVDSPFYTVPFVVGVCLLVSFVLKPLQTRVRNMAVRCVMSD